MKKYITFIILLILIQPTIIFAGSSNVTNVISNSVNTGGDGETKSNVKVFTEINGEVVEDFEKEIEGETEFQMEVKREVNSGTVETEIKINTGETPVPKVGLVKKILNYVFSFFTF